MEILPEIKKAQIASILLGETDCNVRYILKKSEFPTFFRSKELMRFDT